MAKKYSTDMYATATKPSPYVSVAEAAQHYGLCERTLRRLVEKGTLSKPRPLLDLEGKQTPLKVWMRKELDQLFGARMDRATACRVLGVSDATLRNYVKASGKGQVFKDDVVAAIKKRGSVNESALAWLLGLTHPQAWYLGNEILGLDDYHVDPRLEETAWRWDEIAIYLPPNKLEDHLSSWTLRELRSFRSIEPPGYQDTMMQRDEDRLARPAVQDERRRLRIEREAKQFERKRRRTENKVLYDRHQAAYKALLATRQDDPRYAEIDRAATEALVERNTKWQPTRPQAIREWWDEEGQYEAARKFAKIRRSRTN